jgi:hypothetical protein
MKGFEVTTIISVMPMLSALSAKFALILAESRACFKFFPLQRMGTFPSRYYKENFSAAVFDLAAFSPLTSP